MPAHARLSRTTGVATRAAVGCVGLQIDAVAVAERGAARTRALAAHAASSLRTSAAAQPTVGDVGGEVAAHAPALCLTLRSSTAS